MDRIIEVKVYGNHLTKDSNYAGTRGEANITKLRITFDEGWDDFAKEIIFWDAYGENPVKSVLTIDLIENIVENERIYLVRVPGEALERAGEITFVIAGYLENGEGQVLKQVAAEGKLEVKSSPMILASLDPTPNELQQIQGEFEYIIGNIQRAIVSATTASNSAASAEEFANNAKEYMERAKSSDEAALVYSEDASNSATSSATFKNKAKEHMEQASISSNNAEKAAENAFAYSESAEASATSAKNSANEAKATEERMNNSIENIEDELGELNEKVTTVEEDIIARARIDSDNTFTGNNFFWGNFEIQGRPILTELTNVEEELSQDTQKIEELVEKVTTVEEDVLNLNSEVKTINEAVRNKADVLVIESEKATSLILTDTKEAPLVDYKIYGNANGVGSLDETTEKYMLPVTMYGKNLLNTTHTSDVYQDGVRTNDDYSITVNKGQNLATLNGVYVPVNVRTNKTSFMVNNDGVEVTASCKGISSEIHLIIYHTPLLKGEVDKYFTLKSGSKTYSNVPKGTKFLFYIQIPKQGIVSKDTTLYPQLEFGTEATEYEKYVEPVTTYIPLPEPMAEGDYVDYANKKIVAQGNTYEDVELPEIITNYPSTSLVCDGEMEVTYKADTTNAYNNLKSELDIMKRAIIELGGVE